MRFLVAILGSLFLACVWATPAKADGCDCGQSFQRSFVVQQQAYVPVQRNIIVQQRAFVPVQRNVIVQQRSFRSFGAFDSGFGVNRQFGLVNVNRGFGGGAFAPGGFGGSNVQFGLFNFNGFR